MNEYKDWDEETLTTVGKRIAELIPQVQKEMRSHSDIKTIFEYIGLVARSSHTLEVLRKHYQKKYGHNSHHRGSNS